MHPSEPEDAHGPRRPPFGQRVQVLMRDRRFVVGLGGAVLVMLVVVGFMASRLVARSPIAAEGASPSARSAPTSTATADSTPIPSPSSSATAAPSVPSPSPTATPPPEPPAAVALGGWTIVGEADLNVRDAPGLDARQRTQLHRGWVAYVESGPVDADGWNWYELVLLGGGRGWAAAGPESDPFMTTFTPDSVLIHCGAIDAPEPRMEPMPVTIGAVTMPSHLFDALAQSVLLLEEGTGAEGCISADGQREGGPVVLPQIGHTACGQPELAEDGVTWLRPAAAQDVVAEWKVKSSVRVLAPLLTGRDVEDDVSLGLNTVFSVLAAEGSLGCFDAWSRIDVHHESHHAVYGSACVVVTEQSDVRIRLHRTSSDQIETLYPIAGQFPNEELPIGTPFGAILYAGTYETDGNLHDASIGVTPDPALSC